VFPVDLDRVDSRVGLLDAAVPERVGQHDDAAAVVGQVDHLRRRHHVRLRLCRRVRADHEQVAGRRGHLDAGNDRQVAGVGVELGAVVVVRHRHRVEAARLRHRDV
jgi:hypothetical protein